MSDEKRDEQQEPLEVNTVASTRDAAAQEAAAETSPVLPPTDTPVEPVVEQPAMDDDFGDVHPLPAEPGDLPLSDDEVKHESAKRTRRSFVVGGVAAAAGYTICRYRPML
jgi:hypothetical protein